MKITLRQLALFECVARHLSYTRAAEEKHLAQAVVNIQVKQFEEHAGLPLLEYIGKTLSHRCWSGAVAGL